MRKIPFLVGILTLILILITLSDTISASYVSSEAIIIHSDGSVTPSSAPIVRSGNIYTVTDDIAKPGITTNEGIIIEKDNIILDGKGHELKGNGQGSAILMEGRSGVTVKGFLLTNFYWGIEVRNCTQCVFYQNNLSAIMYPIYLVGSSNNKFYHNNIYGYPFVSNSNNIWDNGYPSGGNYWDGYPYADVKSGANQDQLGSDGIGDIPVGEEIFGQGGNVDRYPLISPMSIGISDSEQTPPPTVYPTTSPTVSPPPQTTPTPTSTGTQTDNAFPTEILIVGGASIVAITVITIVLLKKRTRSLPPPPPPPTF
ncbi:MAG: NosD domain-containing protein [Candidatus Bathyarchaeia archaeon]